MKKLVNSIIIIFLTIVSSCGKEKVTNAEVFRNCTGTYLLIDNKNYNVCNYKILNQIEDYTLLNVKCRNIDYCENHRVMCDMVFPFESYVEIVRFKE